MKWLLLAALCLAPTLAVAQEYFADPVLGRGSRLAWRECGGCHAIHVGEKSPNVGAPTLAEMRVRYNPIGLERRLAGVLRNGHPTMPPRKLSSEEISDLVAYIQTLEPPPSKP